MNRKIIYRRGWLFFKTPALFFDGRNWFDLTICSKAKYLEFLEVAYAR